ncbi:MAG: diguanylate cyclase [Desulfobacteraceae bacterium]|nr:diguanylate cyclase [Desulfobacteraceae bacterium]
MTVKMIIIASLLISSGITLFLSFYASRKLRSIGSVSYILLMISISFYSFGYAFELYNTTVEGIYLALKIEYIGITTMPTFWVILAMKYTGHWKKLPPYAYVLLSIVPVIIIILVYTNNFHHLYYTELGINKEGPFPLASISKGVCYYINILYSNILIFGGNVLFFRMILHTSGIFKKQAAVMFFTSLIPWVGNILYQLGLSPYGIDITPFFLTTTGPLFALALFRFRMFDIAPIARDTIFEKMNNPVIVLDNGNRIADINDSAVQTFNLIRKSVIGTVVNQEFPGNGKLIHKLISEGSDTMELELKKNGELVIFNASITIIHSSSNRHIGKIITFHDITPQKIMQQKLHKLATTDELTGLYNRRHFIEKSINELRRARRYRTPLSILLIDLDFFKTINDTYGHQAGDTVLIHTARSFNKSLRSSDVPGRYGGEEFAVLLPDTDDKGAWHIASRLGKNLSYLKIPYEKHEILITASIGISTFRFDTFEINEKSDNLLANLMREADQALYKAKEEGRNRVVIYSVP